MAMWWNSPRPPCFTGTVRKKRLASLEKTGSWFYRTGEHPSPPSSLGLRATWICKLMFYLLSHIHWTPTLSNKSLATPCPGGAVHTRLSKRGLLMYHRFIALIDCRSIQQLPGAFMYSPFDNYPLKLNSFEVGQRQATCGSETGATTGKGKT